MPVLFNNEEYGTMIFIYGFCNRNSQEAVQEYQRHFPERRHPSNQVLLLYTDVFEKQVALTFRILDTTIR
jgi:hypothetical protein